MSNIKFVKCVFIFLSSILSIIGCIYLSGVRINTTASVPQGIWLLSKAQRIKHGDIVSVCISDNAVVDAAIAHDIIPNGFCRNGTRPLFKPVVGVAGDMVHVDVDVEVNGNVLKNSRRLPLFDLPVIDSGDYVVPDNHIWLMSSYHPASFDSRYFGSVSIEQVNGIMEPLWLW